jgi:hypothetical protein
MTGANLCATVPVVERLLPVREPSMRRLIRLSSTAGLAIILALCPIQPARASDDSSWRNWFPESLLPGDADMSQPEAQSMACMLGAASATGATAVASGAVIIAGTTIAIATGTAIAIPVLVGTASAGCTLAQNMAPALGWMRRHGNSIVSKIETPW